MKNKGIIDNRGSIPKFSKSKYPMYMANVKKSPCPKFSIPIMPSIKAKGKAISAYSPPLCNP